MIRFEDWFIARAGLSLHSHVPNTPEDFETATGPTWVRWNGNTAQIVNNILSPDTIDYFGVAGSTDLNSQYAAPVVAPTDFRYTVRFWLDAEGPIIAWFCGSAVSEYLEIRYTGEVMQFYARAAGVSSQVGSDITVAADRQHLLEVEVNSDLLNVYLDQERVVTDYDASAYTGRHFGLRFSDTDSRVEWVKVEDYSAITRYYVDISDAGSADSGTIDEPYNRRFQTKTAIESAGAGDRYCFKAGARHDAGWGISDANGVALYGYGKDSTDAYASFARVTEYSGDTLTANGWTKSGYEYYRTQTEAPIVVIEDGRRLYGNCAANVGKPEEYYDGSLASPPHTRGVLNYGLVPEAGSLNPGEWAWENNRVYFRPRDDTIAGKTFELGTSNAVPMTFTRAVNVSLYGLKCYGSAAVNAQMFFTESSQNVWGYDLQCNNGGHRGLTMGNNGVHQNNGLFYCLSRDVIWKGISTQGPLTGQMLKDSLIFGCMNLRIGDHVADVGDCEGTMLTPGSNGVKVLFGKSNKIGYLGASYNYKNGLVHPVGFSNDGGFNNTFGYCRVWNTRCGFLLGSTADHNASGLQIYNWLTEGCGDNTDPNPSRPASAVHLRTVEDRQNPGVHLTLDDCIVEHGTVTDCAFDDAGATGAGMFSAWTRKQTNPDRYGGELEAIFRYNLVDDTESKTIFWYETDSIDGECHVDSYGNYVYAAGVTSAGRHTGNEISNTYFPATTDLQDRVDPVSGTQDETTASVWPDASIMTATADPDLDASYRPQDATLLAANLASGSTVTHDLLLNERTSNAPGAFEPASEPSTITATGALAAQSADLGGEVDTDYKRSSGTLEAQAAAMSGEVSVIRTVTGTFQAQASVMDGVMGNLVTATGAFEAQAAGVSGQFELSGWVPDEDASDVWVVTDPASDTWTKVEVSGTVWVKRES